MAQSHAIFARCKGKLEELAIKHPEKEALVGGFYMRETFLHRHCLYLGKCPPQPVERKVREDKAYIEDARRLSHK